MNLVSVSSQVFGGAILDRPGLGLLLVRGFPMLYVLKSGPWILIFPAFPGGLRGGPPDYGHIIIHYVSMTPAPSSPPTPPRYAATRRVSASDADDRPAPDRPRPGASATSPLSRP